MAEYIFESIKDSERVSRVTSYDSSTWTVVVDGKLMPAFLAKRQREAGMSLPHETESFHAKLSVSWDGGFAIITLLDVEDEREHTLILH